MSVVGKENYELTLDAELLIVEKILLTRTR